VSKLRVEVENFYISYSDMVTLLLIFFVYLFSISEIDSEKLTKASESVRNEMTTENTNTSLNQKMIQRLELEQKKLQEIEEEVQTYITENGLEETVSVKYRDGQLDLNLGDAILFERGKADLKPQALSVLSKLGALFAKTDSNIVVEGHTDDIPIRSTLYPSNWELSSSRAAAVVRYMETLGVPAGRFMVIGYNQFKPMAPNTTEANRIKNRRVKLTVKPDADSLLNEVKVEQKAVEKKSWFSTIFKH